MFPQPSGLVLGFLRARILVEVLIHRRDLGPSELVAPLLSRSSLSAPLLSTSASSPNTLSPFEVEPFLQDLAKRFEPENEIDGVLGPVVTQLCCHPSLFRPEGLAGGDASWRSVIGGLEALVSIKSIAMMITRLENWIPPNATAPDFERVSLLGPLLRLGVFEREWVRRRLSATSCLAHVCVASHRQHILF